MSTNWALASNGGVASGANAYSSGPGTDYDLAWANNGGSPLFDGTNGHAYFSATTDPLQIDFSGSQSIDTVVVWFSDFDGRSTDPADGDDATGIFYAVDFTIETWNGSSWDVRDTISGNTKLKRTSTFSAVSTTAVRLNVSVDYSGAWGLQEIQAFGPDPNVGSAAGTSAVNGVGNSTAPEGAAYSAGIATVTGVSSIKEGAGASSGTAVAESVGVKARCGVGSSSGVSKALAHPDYTRNYLYAETASLIQEISFAGTATLSLSDKYFDHVRWGAGSDRLFFEGETVRFTWAIPHWIVGAVAYSGIELLTASSEPSDVATSTSGYLGTPGNANPWGLYTAETGQVDYPGPAALQKQLFLFPDGPVYTDVVEIRQLTHDPSSPFSVYITELQIIGLGMITGLEAESIADASTSVIAVHTIPFESTGDSTSTVIATGYAKLTDGGQASDSVVFTWTAKAVGEASGSATAASYTVLEEVLEDGGDAADSISLARTLKLHSDGVLGTSLSSKIAHSEISTGTATDALDGDNSITQSEESTGEAADTVIGVRRVTVVEISGGVGGNASAESGKIDLVLASSGQVSSTVETTSAQSETIESTGHAEETVPVPFQGSFPVFWSNSMTGGAATWNGLPFNSFIEADGVVYAAGPSGIFELGDDLDDDQTGEPIDVPSEIEWDLVDQGSVQMKRMRSMYVNARTAAPFTVRVANEQGIFEYQTETADTESMTNHRAKIGRGITSRSARVSLLHTKAFTADGAGVGVLESTRRI